MRINDGKEEWHTGIVISYDSDKGKINTIEGNKSDKVGTRTISINSSYIQGYGVNVMESKGGGGGNTKTNQKLWM